MAVVGRQAAFVDMIFEHRPDILRTDPRAKQHRFLLAATLRMHMSTSSHKQEWYPSDRIITQLIRNGADPSVINQFGYSPLLHVLAWAQMEAHFLRLVYSSDFEGLEVYVPRLIRLLWHPDLDQDLEVTGSRWWHAHKEYEVSSIASSLRTILGWASASVTDDAVADSFSLRLNVARVKVELAAAVAKTVRLVCPDDGTGKERFELIPESS